MQLFQSNFHFQSYFDGLVYCYTYNSTTAKNTKLSPNFMIWEFCAKAQFPHSFDRFARNFTETVPLHKISTPEN